jgi:uncharacterized protein
MGIFSQYASTTLGAHMTTDTPSLVPSPCIDVCKMNDSTQQCEGCKRNLDEIARWAEMTNAEKLWVLQQLPARSSYTHRS